MKQDSSPPVSPRITGAVFFAIYALLFLFFAKYTLLSLQNASTLPFFPSMLVALLLGAFAGSISSKWLAKSGASLRTLLIGIIIAVLALLILSLGAFIHSCLNDPVFFNRLHHWQDYFLVYGAIFLSLLLIIGVWLVPLTALAAVYFNKRFLPGILALEQLRQQTAKRL